MEHASLGENNDPGELNPLYASSQALHSSGPLRSQQYHHHSAQEIQIDSNKPKKHKLANTFYEPKLCYHDDYACH